MAEVGESPPPQSAVDGYREYVIRGDISIQGDDNTVIIQKEGNQAEIDASVPAAPAAEKPARPRRLLAVVLMLPLMAGTYLFLAGVIDEQGLAIIVTSAEAIVGILTVARL